MTLEKAKGRLVGIAGLLFMVGASAHANVIKFTVNGLTTYPSGINKSGQVCGAYFINGAFGAFVRDTDGTITPFDAANPDGTTAAAIDDDGEVTGQTGSKAYARSWDGTITLFNVGKGSYRFTLPCCIQPDGLIAGSAGGGGGATFAFIRDSSGEITKISMADALETEAAGLIADGTIVGGYQNPNEPTNGFIRAPDGTIGTFGVSGKSLWPSAINVNGTIVGYLSDYPQADSWVGFFRENDGVIHTFGVPNATATIPVSVNDNGTIAGYYTIEGVNHGFIRYHRGKTGRIRTFQIGTLSTYVTGINESNMVVGYAIDQTDGKVIGFIRTPHK